MTSKIQLLSFSISFLFGVCFYYLSIINFNLIKDFKSYLKHIITCIYVFDIIIIYVIILYKLNNGYFHIYFLLMVILGYISGYFINNLIKKYMKNYKNIV